MMITREQHIYQDTMLDFATDLIPADLKTRPLGQIFDIRPEPRIILARERLADLIALFICVSPETPAEEQHHAHQERSDNAIGDRILPSGESCWREG